MLHIGAISRPTIFVLPLVAIAALNTFKSFHPTVQDWGIYLWEVSYREGFIKRGLVGEIFGMLTTGLAYQDRIALVPLIHLGLMGVFVLLFVSLAWHAARSQDGLGHGTTVFLVALLLVASPFLPTQALLTGYPDIVIQTLFVAATLLIVKGHLIAAAVVAAAAALVHEGFLFLWVPIFFLLFSRQAADRKRWGTSIVVYLVPIVTGVLSVLLHDQNALRTLVTGSAMPLSLHAPLVDVQFGQSVRTALAIMQDFYAQEHANFLKALLYFVPPVATFAVLVGTAGGFGRRDRARGAAIVVASFLATSSILALAWDLSRLIQWGVLSSAVVALGWLSQARSQSDDAPSPPGARRAGLLVALLAIFYVPSPVVYTYFAWARAYHFLMPEAFFQNPAALASERFVIWYNEKWYLRQPRELSCELASRPAVGSQSCPLTIAQDGKVNGPYRLLAPGYHWVTFRFDEGGACNGGRLAVEMVSNKLRPKVLGGGEFPIPASGTVTLGFYLSLFDAATSDFAVSIASRDGCAAIKGVAIDGR